MVAAVQIPCYFRGTGNFIFFSAPFTLEFSEYVDFIVTYINPYRPAQAGTGNYQGKCAAHAPSAVPRAASRSQTIRKSSLGFWDVPCGPYDRCGDAIESGHGTDGVMGTEFKAQRSRGAPPNGPWNARSCFRRKPADRQPQSMRHRHAYAPDRDRRACQCQACPIQSRRAALPGLSQPG